MIINEAMRLYPAGWAFERYARERVTLGGEPLEKGARLLFSPYLLHRNPRFWRDPERFDPLRFAKDEKEVTAKYAYLPFGAGPRSCIGGRLAMHEMRIALGMMLAHCDLSLEPSAAPLVADGSFKIRLSRPMMVRANPSNDGPQKTPLAI
jgi:cytochrome P450